MAKLNVAQFAAELGLPVAMLLEQLKAAGIAKEEESSPLTEKDKEDLRFGLEHAVDYVALSFVRDARDVQEAAESVVTSLTSAPSTVSGISNCLRSASTISSR